MSEITNAIKARQTQIAQLQSDIETLERAASVMGGGEKTPAEAVRQKAVRAGPAGLRQLLHQRPESQDLLLQRFKPHQELRP